MSVDTNEGAEPAGGGGLSHVVWDQYSAVYFTSVKTLTRSSMKHLIWLEIWRILVFHFRRELKHLTFADTLPGYFLILTARHPAVLHVRLSCGEGKSSAQGV